VNKEIFEKLLKPPYIFIVLGVIVLGIFLKNKNDNQVENETYDTSTAQGFDTFGVMEQISTVSEILENYIDKNREDIQILNEKLDSDIIQLSDLVRTKDASLTKDIKELRDDLDDRKTTVIPKSTPKQTSKIVTVGTWGEDSISTTTLSGIAKNAGISLNTLLNLNPQYKNNPNLIHPGDKVKVS